MIFKKRLKEPASGGGLDPIGPRPSNSHCPSDHSWRLHRIKESGKVLANAMGGRYKVCEKCPPMSVQEARRIANGKY